MSRRALKRSATPRTAPVIVGAVFISGLLVMWHLGHNVIPTLQRKSASDGERPPVSADTAERMKDSVPVAVHDNAGATEPRLSPNSQVVGPRPAQPEPAPLTILQAGTKSDAAPQTEASVLMQPTGVPGETIKSDSLNASISAQPNQPRIPKPRLVETAKGRLIQTAPILFNSGLAQLRPASLQPLNDLAQILKQQAEIRLQIIGHTDNFGVEAANQKISSERAAAVKDYLVSQGIEASRLESVGMGSSSPIESNDTLLGRQANRRIEFLVVSPK